MLAESKRKNDSILEPAPNYFSILVILNLVFGFLVGVCHSTWQNAINNSQMVAGVVKYSENHPWYTCIMKTWTIWDQIGAIFLVLGGNERTLSILISGIMGAVFFLAFSTLVYSLCNHLPISVAFPFLMYFLDLDTDFGVTYPIQLVGSMHSHGVLGQGFGFLILALFCQRKYRIGGFFLGILPSMHAVVGSLLCLTLFICFIWDFKKLWPSFLEAFKYFLWGLLITIISLVVFLNMTADLVPNNWQEISKYVQINARFWDAHRMGGTLLTIGSLIGALGFLFSLSLLTFFKKELPDHAAFPLRIMVVAGIIGGLGCVIYRLPFEFVNSISPYLIAAMPSRWTNIVVMGIIPLLVGLSSYYKDDLGIQLNLVVFLAALTLILTFHPETNWGRLVLATMLFGTCGLLFLLKNPLHKFTFLTKIKIRASIPKGLAIAILFVVSAGMTYKSGHAFIPNKNKLLGWDNDKMFGKIYQEGGYLLTAPGLALPLQLYTRTPVFPGNIIPCLSYTPTVGPMVEKYMKNISGVDIFNPSAEAKRVNGFPFKEVKSFWQSKTLEEWQTIKEKYGITQIFTLSNWKLRLPVLYGPEKKFLNSLNVSKHNQVREYIVYHIP